FSQVCVVGSGLSHVLAVCVLIKNPSVNEREPITRLLKEVLQNVNSRLEQYEKLAKLVIVPEEWTVSNGLLTPTLKIKRNSIDKAFSGHYEEWLHAKEDVLFV
ncbi:MAG: hypothetical protein WBO38_14030, partial [Chitinophagaceae bacterium]